MRMFFSCITVCLGVIYSSEKGTDESCGIGEMNKEMANVAFQRNKFRDVASSDHKPVTGEVYFSAVNKIFCILLSNEEYLRMAIKDLTTGEDDGPQSKEEIERQAEIEEKIFEAMKEVIQSSRKLLFENPNGLEEVESWDPSSESVSTDKFIESISKEMGRCVLGRDSIPGFMAHYKLGKYRDVSSLIKKISSQSDGIFNLKIIAPIYSQWDTQKDPSCDIITYVLLVVFCIRLKLEPFVIRLSFSV